MAAKKKPAKAELDTYLVVANGQEIEIEADRLVIEDGALILELEGRPLQLFADGAWSTVRHVETEPKD